MGTGYPFGLRGRDIPLCGRVAALADVYDALTSRRVYKAKMSHAQARRRLFWTAAVRTSSPDIVEAFVRREEDIRSIAQALDSTATPLPELPTPDAAQVPA